MALQNLRNRRAFTLVDLMISSFMCVVLVGLLSPALKRLDDAAERKECAANFRQLAIASNSFANDNRTYAPAAWYGDEPLFRGDDEDVARYDTDPPFRYGWGYLLLPYVEHFEFYRAAGNPPDVRKGATGTSSGAAVASQTIVPYLCPTASNWRNQFTGQTLQDGKGWGRGSYAINAGPALITESINGILVDILPASPKAKSPLVAGPVSAVNFAHTPAALSVADGTGATILFSEVRIGLTEKDLRGTWALAMPGASIICGNAGRRGDDAYDPITRCSQPNDKTKGSDAIQDCPDPGDGSWEKEGMGCTKDKIGSRFAQARSRHKGGVNIVMADGSCRFVKDDIDNLTWFLLLSANDGQNVPDF